MRARLEELMQRLVARHLLALDVAALRRVVVLGFVLRGLIVLISEGTNDIFTWHSFGHGVNAQGLLDEYRRVPYFNHPPLMGYFSVLAFKLDELGWLRFAVAFKLLPLAADALSTRMLWSLCGRRGGELAGWRAGAVFAASPVAISISAYHGNTDPLGGMMLLAAVYAFVERRSAFLGGLALAGAVNVKLIPVLVLPALALHLVRGRDLALAGLGFLLGLAPFVMVLPAWEAFYVNAIAYGSNGCRWGMHLLLWSGVGVPGLDALFAPIAHAYDAAGRYLMLGASAWIGWRWRGRDTYQVAALAMASFLILTPGFGVQYLAFVVPVLVAADLGAALRFSAAGGAFLLVVYGHFGRGAWPLQSIFTGDFPQFAAGIGLIAWLVLVQFSRVRLATARHSAPATK